MGLRPRASLDEPDRQLRQQPESADPEPIERPNGQAAKPGKGGQHR